MTKFISKGKGRKKRTFPIRPKKKGVSIRSVSLKPKAELVINKRQIKLINQGKSATFSKALNDVILRKKKDLPIYDTHVNTNERRKPYIMHVTDMKKHRKVKGSDTIVMADSYGQAIDDFITVWNKDPNRMQMQIGYPVVQGTAMKNFRYKKDQIRTIRDLDGREDFDLVQVDTDIDHFHDFLGLEKGTYDGLFIKQKDGDVVEAYGYNGSVPALHIGVERIETPTEKLEKRFADERTRLKRSDDWDKPMTESEQKKTLEVLNLIDGLSKGGLDKEGKELQKELKMDLGIRKARLVDSIKHGDKVTILTPRGQKLTGRAVMKSALGGNSWVLNTGGAHGTPALASDDNVIKVVEGR